MALTRGISVISVIIPTLNEASELPETLARLARQDRPMEIVVVDAGSADETVTLARKAGARVMACDRRQRAHQFNLGAAEAEGDILWFLHADTWVSGGAARAIEAALDDPKVIGGGFKRRFRSPSLLLRCSCMVASLRSRFFGLYFGDQSIFVRREQFAALGGFAGLPVFEDFDFCQRLKRRGPMVCLGPPVRSSARRFERGACYVTLRDLWLTTLYHLGENPHRIWQRMNQG